MAALRKIPHIQRRWPAWITSSSDRNAVLCRVDAHQLIGMSKGQRSKHQGVNRTENCSVGADAQCQRQHRYNRKTWIPAKGPCTVPYVSPESLQSAPAAYGAYLLRNQSCVPKRPLRGISCVLRRQTGFLLLLRLQL